MRFYTVPLLALAAVVTAQSTDPKISADELVESMKVITEAVNDAVELTSDLPSENQAVSVSSGSSNHASTARLMVICASDVR